MFEKIINFSIQNKLVIGIMTLLLIVWGAVSLGQLPFDSTPDITNNTRVRDKKRLEKVGNLVKNSYLYR